jgi:hypothetical protein
MGPSSATGRRRPARAAIALLVTAVAAWGFSTGANAGRPNTPSSIAIASVTAAPEVDALIAPAPTVGTTVTFTTSYPKTVKNPRIEVLCYQFGSLVYGEAGGVDNQFVLGGGWSLWLGAGGGPADCVANLYYFGYTKGQQTYELLATTSFAAS